MGKQNNRICIICGKSYSFCPVCNSEDSGKPSWYFIFDDQNCHDIYETCVAYRDKNITIAEAQKRIKELNVDGLDNFADATKEQIKEIMAYKSKSIKTVDKSDVVKPKDTNVVKENQKVNNTKINKLKK